MIRWIFVLLCTISVWGCHPECISAFADVALMECHAVWELPRVTMYCDDENDYSRCFNTSQLCYIHCDRDLDQCEMDSCPACETHCPIGPICNTTVHSCQLYAEWPRASWVCRLPFSAPGKSEDYICETPACLFDPNAPPPPC